MILTKQPTMELYQQNLQLQKWLEDNWQKGHMAINNIAQQQIQQTFDKNNDRCALEST